MDYIDYILFDEIEGVKCLEFTTYDVQHNTDKFQYVKKCCNSMTSAYNIYRKIDIHEIMLVS